ncbi:hypothetical protein ACFWNN_45290 [Lentzea sp. NPDC058450]|uniref:hypothetical protein n=1 Tax=Lentzea sp. NPDC058450 TaxID=3346505 RepID=UPI00364CA691
MPRQFGEDVPAEELYRQAREALGFMSDESLQAQPVSSDIQKRAMVDELAARGLPPRELPDTPPF